MVNKKTLGVILLSIIIIITTLILIIVYIDKTSKPPSIKNQSASQKIPNIAKNPSIPAGEIGFLAVDEAGWNLYLTSTIKYVEKINDKVIINIESKNLNGDTFNQDLLVFKEGSNREFIILATTDLVNFQTITNTQTLETVEKTFTALSKYQGQKIISNIHLSPSLKKPILTPFKENIKCNDEFLTFLSGKIKKPNCEGFSIEIYVKN